MKKLRSLLLICALGLAGLTAGCMGLGGSESTVTILFNNTSGLFLGNDVGVLGVKVGHVVAIKPVGTYVRVTVKIDSKRNIPADASALVVSRSVATNRYIELSPVYTGGAKLENGATIPLDRTREPVEFDDLVGSLTKFGDALIGSDPKNSSLKDAFTVLATTVNGNGQRIHDAISKVADSLNTIGGQTGNITDTVNSLDKLTTAMATNDSTLRQFSESVTKATSMLADQHGDIEAALNALNAALIELANFAQKHSSDLTGQVKNLTTIGQNILEKRTQLEELVEVLPLALQNVQRVTSSNGTRLRVRLPTGALSPGNLLLSTLCTKVPKALCDALDTSLLGSLGLVDLSLLNKLGGL